MPEESVKDRLLEAAIVCLQRDGYAATTARDVAAEAHANLRSIGYHYGSTRGLLLAAISANWRRWLAPLIAATTGDAASGSSTPEDSQPANSLPERRLAEGMALFAAALAENAPMAHAWLEAVTLAPRDAELRATLAANQHEFRAALARNLAAAGQPDADARARAIVAVCDGLVVHFLLYGNALRVEDVAYEAAAALAEIGDRSA
ncbi:MAG TPA: TetR family transcriptional regulator C-terminal domain-containing protein [Solirubrobacteraceae bacterium]|jgi:AcrR family transcriptional regulator